MMKIEQRELGVGKQTTSIIHMSKKFANPPRGPLSSCKWMITRFRAHREHLPTTNTYLGSGTDCSFRVDLDSGNIKAFGTTQFPLCLKSLLCLYLHSHVCEGSLFQLGVTMPMPDRLLFDKFLIIRTKSSLIFGHFIFDVLEPYDLRSFEDLRQAVR